MTEQKTITRRDLAAMATASAAIAAFGATPAAAAPHPQPAMEAAKLSLHLAKSQLQAASPDKGGHRLRAISYVDAAIAEVQLGIDFANS